MFKRKWIFVFILITFICANFSSFGAEKLTEEQMTAYRTIPAVVLIYSGMYVKVSLESGQTIQIPYYGSGSGFFVNSEGYLVTNGHVVKIFQDYDKDKSVYANNVAYNYFISLITANFKKNRGRMPTRRELQAEYLRFKTSQDPIVAEHGGINYVLLSNSETHRFEIKKYSPSIPEGGKDIAVLKIERDNCPMLMLGDSSGLTLQQRIFTIGFPAKVDPSRFPLLGKENAIKPSITGGAITALKTDYKGMSVIQHDAAASHGNSGGPTVDSKGRVIGVLSYGVDESFLFCVPVNTAKEFIRETGIDTNKTSEFTKVFNKLMESVWEERWFDARTHVTTALAYMKDQPDLEKLQQIILRRISEMGFVEKIWTQNKLIVIAAVVLVVLILLVLKMALFPSTRRQPAVAAPPAVPVLDKTRVVEDTGTLLEIDAVGSVTVLVDGEEKGSFSVTSKGLIVGRDASAADVHIPKDIVSKTHLKILPKEGQFFLLDLGSTNGTYVNGAKIKESVVGPNDLVQLGKKGEIKLVFRK